MTDTRLATTGAAVPAPINLQREKLLRDLIMRDASPTQVELVMNICERYGFDPLLKHVVLIGGNLYVTRDGLIHNAHQSGEFDGIEVEAEPDPNAAGKWIATATVWRKGYGHPFRYSALQTEHEKKTPSWGQAPRAMTIKCAEVMALRRAFDISLGSVEEMGFDALDADYSVHEPPRPAPAAIPAKVERPAKPAPGGPKGPASRGEIDLLMGSMREFNWGLNDVRRWCDEHGITFTKWSDLTGENVSSLRRDVVNNKRPGAETVIPTTPEEQAAFDEAFPRDEA